MPGRDVEYPPGDLGLPDLYPTTYEEHRRLLTWCLQAFEAADAARRPFEQRWQKYYRMYRSYIKRDPHDWRSKVFVPYTFSTIEGIVPRIFAQLPRFIAAPVSPEDVEPAKLLELELNRAAVESGLYLELVTAGKSALIYGTGILKTYYRRDTKRTYRRVVEEVPVLGEVERPVLDPETGRPLLDPDGNPVTERVQEQVGVETVERTVPVEYVAFEGPAAVAVDLWDFWVAPEATDIKTARYVIHRSYRPLSHVLRLMEEGVYHMPPGMTIDQMTEIEDEGLRRRLAEVQLDAGAQLDPNRRPTEILEFWTDDNRLITVLNRKAVIRHTLNPYDHGEKPFIRFVDYLVPHEFWGIGEVEAIEGLQDVMNVLVNQRIDNLRIVLNPMFAVDVTSLEDPRDLRVRPGGVIRIRGGQPVSEVFMPVPLGDVTVSAFKETELLERLVERVSGVTPYQIGTETTSYNETATGVALIQEAGATKFALKVRLMEQMGLRELAKQWGSLIQQFTTEERLVRVYGPGGEWLFRTLTPESVQGAVDFDIEVTSTQQTESVRRQIDLQLLQVASQAWPNAVPRLFQDLLEDFGKKDIPAYMWGPQLGIVPGMNPPGVPPMSVAAPGGVPEEESPEETPE